jgi:hypothetical protein
MKKEMIKDKFTFINQNYFYYCALFILGRMVLILVLPIEGLRSYGDYWNYFYIAGLGTPFIDLWVEFPPLFPFLARLLYLLVGGSQNAFEYLLAMIFSFVQAGNLYLFQVIARKQYSIEETKQRTLTYLFIIINLFYGWAYFDSLVVFTLLLGVYWILEKKDIKAGIALGIGGLIKWFPMIALAASWKWRGRKGALQTIGIAFILVVLVWGILFSSSPELTRASLVSQGIKGSWETIWAIIDENLGTGNFDREINRLDPGTAYFSTSNEAKLSPWISLIAFAFVGFGVFLRSRLNDESKMISFTGFSIVVFILWSPGYSPQWVLLLLPFILLSFDIWRGTLMGLVLVLINILEWPIFLSRGWFHLLEEIIVLRTIVMLGLAGLFICNIFNNEKGNEGEEFEIIS